MRLKKLEMQGFKSFADKTEITFGDGVTAVVGPNGSGKSNISDAIRWVMGEQSAKTLRGSKMGDVIFSGTQSRKPVGFCQVSLVFENEDHWLPVEFNEVTVSRRYYKSGESEYFINKTLCRLKDVLELFRDTGAGREGYSIIGQGQITNILSSNSAERRQVFEAATGVLKYKMRKAEAESRLKKTVENIVRLEDILAEMTRSLDTLDEQAKDAKAFIACRDQLKELELASFCDQHQKLSDKLAKADEELDTLVSSLAEDEARETAIQKEKETQNQSAAALTQQLEAEREKLARIHEAFLEADAQSRLMRQRLDTMEQEQGRNRELQTDLKEQLAGWQEISFDREKGQKEQALELARSHLDEAEQALHDGKTEEARAQNELDQLKQKKIDYLNQSSQTKINTSRLNAMLDTACERLKALAQAKTDLSKKIAQMERDREAYARRADQSEEKKNQVVGSVQARRGEKEQLKERRNAKSDQLHELQVKLQGITSKHTLLTNMQAEYEGYTYAVKNLMKQVKGDERLKASLLGTVADVITVPGEYVRAVETVLGGGMQNVITPTEQDAKRLIQALKEQKLGRATFLPLSIVKPVCLNDSERRQILGRPGVYGIASELIEFEPRFAPAVGKLLGRTVLVDNIDTAIQVMKDGGHRFTTVTLEGDVMHPGGSMTGGSRGKNAVGILSRNEEKKRLAERGRELAGQIQGEKQSLEKLQGQIQAVEEELMALHEDEEAAVKAYEDERNSVQAITIQIEGEKANYDNLNTEAEQLQETKQDIENQLAGTMAQQADDAQDVDDGVIAAAQQALYAAQQRREELMQHMLSAMEEKNKREKELARFAQEQERAAENQARIQRQLTKAQEEWEQGEKKIAAQKEQLVHHTHENSHQEAAEKTQKDVIAHVELQMQAALLQVREADERLQKLREQNRDTVDRRYDLQIQREKWAMERQQLAQEVFEKYDAVYEDVAENYAQTPYSAREIHSLKSQIRMMGNVNLNAIEDYAELHSRHENTVRQLEDLNASKTDLEELISMLFQTMTTQFQEQFVRINEEFGRIFQSLFGGGTASLKLSDAEHAMESDIEIVAQPPGKKLQTLSLLSGGEKALTAIAILFAMLELKPTPFCVLDEIEAALDEANVYGFAKYLANYSNKTQFIVITHRRGVMDHCNAIYGIAMQEKGISKVVSMKMEEEEHGAVS